MLTITVFATVTFTVLADGTSNQTGVSSVFLSSALDHEAMDICDLLVKIVQKLLGDICLLSKSKIVQSKELCTLAG